MTPAITLVKKHSVDHKIHQYQHDPYSQSYGQEAAKKLGLNPTQVFKTLVIRLDNEELVVALLPVSCMLSLKRLAKAAGSKRAIMADQAIVERTTGYLQGGISPLGQKKRLRTFIDSSAQKHATVYISAGRRGLELELAPTDLGRLSQGRFTHLGTHSQ